MEEFEAVVSTVDAETNIGLAVKKVQKIQFESCSWQSFFDGY